MKLPWPAILFITFLSTNSLILLGVSGSAVQPWLANGGVRASGFLLTEEDQLHHSYLIRADNNDQLCVRWDMAGWGFSS